MADKDLPLWSVQPNWSSPVTERLEWLTDVLQSRSMAEQRRALRRTPRRSFEFKINPVDRVRSYVDQWLHRLSADLVLLPLWHDQGALTATATATQSRLYLDTRWREFEVDGVGVVWTGPFTYEVFQVSAITDDYVDLADPLVSTWAAGSKVYPARRAKLDTDSKLAAITSRVGDAVMNFTLDTANPMTTGAEVLPAYDGHPLVSLEPNRLDSLEQQFHRVMDELDSDTGKTYRVDPNSRAFQTQFYNWRADGRQQHSELRQTLYRLKGRQKAVWLPSFNRDLVTVEPVISGDTTVRVENIGYTLLGGVAPGRDRVLVKDDTGAYQAVEITGSAVISADVEELTLSAATTFAVDAGTHCAFLSRVRMDQDSVEIVHHTDSEGVCEVSAAFRSFSGERVAPTVLLQPVPAAVMTDTVCGTITAVPCYVEAFDGWDYEVSLKEVWTKHKSETALYIWPPPGGAGGNAIGSPLGSDFYDKFPLENPEPNTQWRARRVNLETPDTDSVGHWDFTLDVGVNNFHGETPANYINLYLYIRHWSEAWPGRMVASWLNYTSNADLSASSEETIDWRDFR